MTNDSPTGSEFELTSPVSSAAAGRSFNPVSGRYRGKAAGYDVELRVDVDGARCLTKLSGDFFAVSGATVSYFGSFIVDNPTVTVADEKVTAHGEGRYTFKTTTTVVHVTIPLTPTGQAQATAVLQFFTSAGKAGTSYSCAFDSPFFRTVLLETDRVSDLTTPVFTSYDTERLPSGGAPRRLSVVSAYAEAGIGMVPSGSGNSIDVGEAGGNKTWSNAELHASMVRHFSLYRDDSQWAVWQVVCQAHDQGPSLAGVMFDQIGPQRQGCAVFHGVIGGDSADRQRLQLYTYVHELGHCFNMLHSWQKSLARPPGINRPGALSYMNYPQNYPGGAAAYWNGFAFQFDDPELLHLRHAFRKDIILGGNPFMTGNAAIVDSELFSDAVEDRSTLDFTISAPHRRFALGEPVSILLTLRSFDRRGATVQPVLDPRASGTVVAVIKPNGTMAIVEPLLDHLVFSTPRFLSGEEEIRHTAYIGYGKNGMIFDQPGCYKIRVAYYGMGGAPVMSNILSLRVRYPVSEEENDLADLLLGDEQGALLWLLGSDSEALQSGNDAFDEILDKYPRNPLADYVRIVRGVNLARSFTVLGGSDGGRTRTRVSKLEEAKPLLASATGEQSRIDIRVQAACLRQLAGHQSREGDDEGAKASTERAKTLRDAFLARRRGSTADHHRSRNDN